MNHAGVGYVTVGRFPAMIDLALVEALLREQEVRYRVLDETTATIIPPLASSSNGVRLQVHPDDVERTLALLAEQRIPVERVHAGSPLLDWFDVRTRASAWLARRPLGARFVLLMVPVAMMVALVLFATFRKSLAENLAGPWCVSTITIGGQRLELRPLDPNVSESMSGCEEYMDFATSGILRLGADSPEISAHWRVLRGNVILERADSLGGSLDGTYVVEIDADQLVMTNDLVVIKAVRGTFLLLH